MKTLIFNGSPRAKGDTVSLIKELTEHLEGEYKIVDAYRSHIAPCIDCRYCRENAGCAFKDEMNEVYDNIEDCDNIVIASPIYFSELTGKMLDVGSRLQTYYCARHFRGEEPIVKSKKGAVILVGGGDGKPDIAYGTAVTLLHQMNAFDIHEPVISHNTNEISAKDDEKAVAGVRSVAGFFNGAER